MIGAASIGFERFGGTDIGRIKATFAIAVEFGVVDLMEKAGVDAAERVAGALINADSGDLASVVREADQACYAAKAAGRNRWRRYDRASKAVA
ncbi:MAG TPA: hypothetical protein ENK26_08895 [Gammaproteobacteria bacterium]|nr:hypothetical protein [Gammaproteobacteria bacterium]